MVGRGMSLCGWKNGFGNHRFPTFGRIFYIQYHIYIYKKERETNPNQPPITKYSMGHIQFQKTTNLACRPSCHVNSRFHLKIKHDEGFPWLLGFQKKTGEIPPPFFFTKGDICIYIWYDLPDKNPINKQAVFYLPPPKKNTKKINVDPFIPSRRYDIKTG